MHVCIYFTRFPILFFLSLSSCNREFITRTFTGISEAWIKQIKIKKRTMGDGDGAGMGAVKNRGKDEKRKQICEHVLTKWMGSLWWHTRVPRNSQNTQQANSKRCLVIYARHVLLLPLPECVWHIWTELHTEALQLTSGPTDWLTLPAIFFHNRNKHINIVYVWYARRAHTLHDFAVNCVYVPSLD